jgi:hypothetical protein
MKRRVPDEAMSEADTELVLAMVDAAGQAVAPDEHRESFDDYARLLRATRVLPDAIGNPADDSAAGNTDRPIFRGIGLALLGHLGGRLLAIATNLALEEGLAGAETVAGQLLRRGDQGDVEALAERTVNSVDVPRETDRSVLVHVVLIQINVLGGR